jgi:cytochrome b561
MALRLANNADLYGIVAVIFHWLTVLFVFTLFALGLYMTSLTYTHPWYTLAPHVHKSLGVIFAVIFTLRAAWRLTNAAPKPAPMPRWEVVAARNVHRALYILPFCVVTAGYLISTADARGVDVFDWFTVPALIHGHERQEDIAGGAHLVLASVTVGLAALHALAGLKHHFIDGDFTLVRMLGLDPARLGYADKKEDI